jgi:hypothetical protein
MRAVHTIVPSQLGIQNASQSKYSVDEVAGGSDAGRAWQILGTVLLPGAIAAQETRYHSRTRA